VRVVRGLLCSAPDGDQHCDDHDGSGGMRKSGYDVDDAGDASNTEIGHVAYLPSRTSVAITPRVRSCRIGLSRAKRESGEGTLAGSQTGYRLEQQQLQCQTRFASPCESRDHGPVRTCRGIAVTRGLSRRRAEKRQSLPSSLSRWHIGIQVALDAQCKNIPHGKHVPWQTGSQRRQPQKQTRPGLIESWGRSPSKRGKPSRARHTAPQSTKDYDKLSLSYLPYRRASGDGFLCG
jgi:hypothetical protein